VTLGAVTVLILAVGLGVARLTLDVGGADLAPFERIRLERLTNRGAIWAAAVSRDGDRIAYAVPEDGGYAVRLKTLDTGVDRQLVGPVATPIKELDFSPDGRLIYYLQQETAGLGYSMLFRIPTEGGTPEELIFDVDSGVASSPDGGRLAFVRGYPGGASALIEVPADGGGEATLAEWHGLAWVLPVTPAWSPDGKEVAVAVRHVEDDVHFEVEIVNVRDGSRRNAGQTRWDGITGLAWLNDGSGLLLAAVKHDAAERSQLWRLDLPGGAATRVSNDLGAYIRLSMTLAGDLVSIRQERRDPALLFREPFGQTQYWAGASRATDAIVMLRRGPDGGAIFTAQDSGRTRLWRIASATAPAEPLLPDSEAMIGRFSVSPDGETVVYEARDAAGIPHLWMVPAWGGSPRQLTDGRGEYAPAACPPGGPIFFVRRDADGLWAVDEPGGSPRRISDIQPVGMLPVCSPEGSRVAFATLAERGTRFEREIVVLPIAGGEPLQRISPFHGRAIAWSPDGEALTYAGQPDSGHTVWQIPLRTGLPEKLFSDQRGLIHSFDWTTDGSRLLLSRVSMSSDVVLVSELR
jgi:Tol biopolymer transport system component